MAAIVSIPKIIFLIWSTYLVSDITGKEVLFSRLNDFDNLVPVSPSLLTIPDVSKSHCAARCVETVDCRIYFYNSNPYVCKLYGVVNYEGTNLVFESDSLSFDKGCKVNGFTSHYGMCFRLFEDALHYTAAKTECDKYNSTLLILDTDDKFKLMLQYLTDREKSLSYLIGLSDIETEGTWMWGNLKPPNLSLFLPNQPNDYDGTAGYATLGADCGTIHWTLGGIGDNYCDKPHTFICEEITT